MGSFALLHADSSEGLKKRIAVADFKDKSIHWIPGNEGAAPGIADALNTALIRAGKCRVLDREPSEAVRQVQDPDASSLGASIIVAGDVAEFGIRHLDTGMGGAVARCVLNLRLIDRLNGHVIVLKKAVGQAAVPFMDEDTNTKKLLAQATRQAIDRAVVIINNHLDTLPWYGRVVNTDRDTIFVDTGRDDDRSVGQEFEVTHPGDLRLDPRTGETLGVESTPVGRIRLVAILGSRSARAVRVEGYLPQTGDVIQ